MQIKNKTRKKKAKCAISPAPNFAECMSKKFIIAFSGYNSTLAPGAKAATCHSCKRKCADVWALLQHVYVAHGLRVSEEDLPAFAFANSTSAAAKAHDAAAAATAAAMSAPLHRPQPMLAATPLASSTITPSNGSTTSKTQRAACKQTKAEMSTILKRHFFCFQQNL